MRGLQDYFDHWWMDYSKSSIQIISIVNLLRARNEQLSNDHIAFRTFPGEQLGIDSQAHFFSKFGYIHKGEYDFKTKGLKAIHLECQGQPKIFLSELKEERLKDFPVIGEIIESCKELSWEQIFEKPRWWIPEYKIYESLREADEYVSWVYAHGMIPNHFTLDLDQLNTFESIEDLISFFEENGIHLNDSGGKLKGSTLQGLIQASTLAEKVSVSFIEGERQVPGRYYEFLQRFHFKGHRFEGFLTENADKIFESTNSK
jgi:hypothetical protein